MALSVVCDYQCHPVRRPNPNARNEPTTAAPCEPSAPRRPNPTLRRKSSRRRRKRLCQTNPTRWARMSSSSRTERTQRATPNEIKPYKAFPSHLTNHAKGRSVVLPNAGRVVEGGCRGFRLVFGIRVTFDHSRSLAGSVPVSSREPRRFGGGLRSGRSVVASPLRSRFRINRAPLGPFPSAERARTRSTRRLTGEPSLPKIVGHRAESLRTTILERSDGGWPRKPGADGSAQTDHRVEQFTESISFDRRLFEHDIRASIAHSEMLAHVGLITSDECEQIVRGLSEIRAEIEAGRFAFVPAREDIHMHIEAALIERLGDVGRKLHTARSRNDQVVTDVKLWARDALDRVDARLLGAAARLGRGGRATPRHDPARLYPPPAGPAGARRALLPGLRREAGPRPRPRWPIAASG